MRKFLIAALFVLLPYAAFADGLQSPPPPPLPLSPSNGGKPSNRYTNFTNTTTFAVTDAANLKMGGYGSSWAITPNSTGKIRITIVGGTNITTASSSAVFNVRYGTGAAPAQGAAVTGSGGTTTDAFENFSATLGATQFTLLYEASGLTLGTAYWVDMTARGGGTTFTPLSVIIEEF